MKQSFPFPNPTERNSVVPDRFNLSKLGQPKSTDFGLWFDRLHRFISSRNIEGTIGCERLNKTEPGSVSCLFTGSIPDHNSESAEEPQILDDPLSLQLDTNGRLYSLGLIEPNGTIYISWEFGKKHRYLSRIGFWGTPADSEPKGDLAHVQRYDNSTTILVTDGLGHGTKAYDASQKAQETLSDYGDERPAYLMEKIHEALSDTRGAVGFIGRINHDNSQLEYCSVGNIKARLINQDSTKGLMAGHGTLGYSLPEPLNQHTEQLTKGASIVCHTDGVQFPDSDFYNEVFNRLSPSLNALRLHDHFKKGTDDALVLVARI